MALSDKLTAPKPAMHGLPCSIGTLLAELEGAERTALETMLADRNWSQDMIWQALRDEGYTAGRQSVNRHRAGKCRCVKDAA
jgi:hypothetical protein